MNELLSLTRENNAMLKRIVAYIDKVDSQGYRESLSIEDFMSNLVANLISSRLECGGNAPNNR